MNSATGSEAKPRGRPRSEKARRAILDAAAELMLAEGLEAVSMDEVAERAGVSKATIYRWWPTKQTLALDALYHQWDTAPPAAPDTGSLRSDLLALIRPWIRRVRARSYGRVVAALIEKAQADPAFAAEYRARFVDPRREPARRAFQRAIERGEISPRTDVDLAIDLVYGPLYHRLLHGHAPHQRPRRDRRRRRRDRRVTREKGRTMSAAETLTSSFAALGGDVDTAFERMGVPVLVIDRSGLIRYLNRCARRWFGDVRDQPFTVIFAPESRFEARDAFTRKLLGTERVNTAQRRLLTLGGEVLARIHAVAIEAGDRVVGVFEIASPETAPSLRDEELARLAD